MDFQDPAWYARGAVGSLLMIAAVYMLLRSAVELFRAVFAVADAVARLLQSVLPLGLAATFIVAACHITGITSWDFVQTQGAALLAWYTQHHVW